VLDLIMEYFKKMFEKEGGQGVSLSKRKDVEEE